MPVAVVVAPGGRPRHIVVGNAGRRGHVGEPAVVVAVQPVGVLVEAHEDVQVAIVVIIGDCIGVGVAGAEKLLLHSLELRPPIRERLARNTFVDHRGLIRQTRENH